jgi:hypothetical protein
MSTGIGIGKGEEEYISPTGPVRLAFAFFLFFARTLIFAFMPICTFTCYTYL